MSTYEKTYQRWQSDPKAFWAEAARDIDWIKPWDHVYAKVDGLDRWFVGALCNTCWNAVDRHVATGHGARTALIYDSPLTGRKQRFTYAELQDEVATLAALLQDIGIVKGDRVLLYMPMIPEAVFAMLACARIGAVHSVVFGGFAPAELATRINDAKPKLIMSASCGIEPGRVVAYKPLIDKAIELAQHKPAHGLVWQRPELTAELTPGRDHDWAEGLAATRKARRKAECVPVKATDPLYVLYTSGTTGQPKGVVRDNGGHHGGAQMVDGRIFTASKPGETLLGGLRCRLGRRPFLYRLCAACCMAATDHPVRGQAGRHARCRHVLARHRADHKVVKALFTAPTAFRAIKKEDPDGNLIAQI